MLIDPKHIRKLKAGNQAAFETIYDCFSLKVYSIAIKFGLNREDANEVVQDVFVKLWNHRSTLNENLSIKSYLFTITKNTLINRQKKMVYEIAYKKYLEKQDLSTFSQTEDDIFYSDLEQFAEACIDKLPAQQKEIFLLSKKKNLPNKEIADKLNLSLRTVENQIYRATKRIKEELKKNGATINLLVTAFISFLFF